MQTMSMLVIHAKELVSLQGPARVRCGEEEMNALGLISDGAMAIQDGKIVAVGTTEQILAEYQADTIINASNKVVIPGLVDPHTHPIFVHTRENEFEMRLQGKTYVEISQSGGGIRSTIRTTRAATKEELVSLASKRIQRMIANGTTTLEAKSGYGLTTESELLQLEAIRDLQQQLPIDIVPTFMGAHEFPEEFKNDHEAYIRILIEEMIPSIVKAKLAEYCDIFTEQHVYQIKESKRVLLAAKAHGLKLKMHADEIEPIGGAELAGELHCTSADHLGAASDAGIAAMKQGNVIPVLLPATIFSLRMASYARARDMIAAGLPVAVATDYNPGSCNCDSMLYVMTLACLQMRMTPAEALVAATINAAYAIDRGTVTGSLEVNKQADFLIMDIPSYRFLPYHFGSTHIEQVYKHGVRIA